eukprot:4632363-Pyramimonas_sp.AAC.1
MLMMMMMLMMRGENEEARRQNLPSTRYLRIRAPGPLDPFQTQDRLFPWDVLRDLTTASRGQYITPVRPYLEVGAPRTAAVVAMLCCAV